MNVSKNDVLSIFIYIYIYIEKALKYFYMDKSHSLTSLTVFRLLDVKKINFTHLKMRKEVIVVEVSYLSATDMRIFYS